ncbi:MAG: glucosaminidase domain-containing protein [Flavobacteriales bacterium]|jgi:LysM repeat protein|nr:glucosaminidase domain-containing protein [Flavobacteriales bacterium]
MKNIVILILLSFISLSALAQPSERFLTRQDYIERWKDEAISQMVKYKIPASITLAQGILESGNGNSELAKYANNHFGIKCHGWDGPGVYKDDDKKDECFRKYADAFQSFEDHSKFLAHRKRYASLFVLEITDYEGWAKGLRKAGYATNPKYANLLIDLIEDNGLYQYDRMEAVVVDSEPGKVLELPQNELVLPAIQPVKHTVLLAQKVRYIQAVKGDTYYKIAKEFDMALWQLYKYNDCDNNTKLKEGERIYLQPKRNRGKKKYHTILSGETLRSIAQEEGVKLKRILKKNGMTLASELVVGQKIKLK